MDSNQVAALSSLLIELVRQKDQELADLLDALNTTSAPDAWKLAGEQLLEAAIHVRPIADAQCWFVLATSCFERYVYLSRQPITVAIQN